jgi:uncharacterized protein (DUF2147 family)
MIRKTGMFALTFLFIAFQQFAFAANETSPVGYWKTIDDVTQQAKSIVHITETNNHELQGQVVKLFPSALKTCAACQGDLKDKPILGMMVIHGLKQNDKNPLVWQDGRALDPKNGKTYRCMATLIENGQKLHARGYIGFPLFGRTQTWLRVNSANAS